MHLLDYLDGTRLGRNLGEYFATWHNGFLTGLIADMVVKSSHSVKVSLPQRSSARATLIAWMHNVVHSRMI
jgi:hypothetical protein